MERLRRLRWNGRTVPPERARRLTGIRKRLLPRFIADFEAKQKQLEKEMEGNL